MAKEHRGGTRFPLLIYGLMIKRWAWPCILLMIASIALTVLMPHIWILYLPWRLLALVPALMSLLILGYAFLARRMAWVQCKANHLHVQTPIYPLKISYKRIKAIRPVPLAQVFPPSQQKAITRKWLRPCWGETAIVIDLSKYPVRRDWLRLWFNPHLLLPDTPGLVFLVGDWMSLSRQIDDYRSNWEMRRAARLRDTAGSPAPR